MKLRKTFSSGYKFLIQANLLAKYFSVKNLNEIIEAKNKTDI